MVLGLRSLSRRESSVHVDYVIRLQEIKPWPPYHMKSSKPVILHWERGDRHSGSTKRITPEVGRGIGGGKIVFNESFLLPATLFREFYNRGRKAAANEKFHKKCLELNLHESKSEGDVKGQLLGCAVIDLAQYGVLRSSTSISVPLKLKKSSKIAAQPLVFLTIGPDDDRNILSCGIDTEGAQGSPSPCSSSRYIFSSGTSLDKDSRDSIADTEITDEGMDEVEVASFTDEEPSPSHPMSTLCASASKVKGNAPLGVPQLEKELEFFHIDSERDQKLSAFPEALLAKAAAAESDRVDSSLDGLSSLAFSEDLSKYSSTSEYRGHLTLNSSERNGYEANILNSEIMTLREEVTTQAPVAEPVVEEETLKRSTGGVKAVEVLDKVARQAKVAQQEGVYPSVNHYSRSTKASMEKQTIGSKHASKSCRDTPKKGTKVHTEVRNAGKNGSGTRVKSIEDSKPKNGRAHTKSISSDSDINSVSELDDKLIEEVKEINISEMLSCNNENGSEDTDVKPGEIFSKEENMKIIFAEARAAVADEKVKQMELEIKKLEGELREAALIEAAVYAVAAEHGGSSHKVHSPARRLARLYIHACKHWTPERRASTARTAASGLILVAKACGNDVPRLTFWWSNTVVLRGIISQAFDSSQSLPQAANSKGSHGSKKNHRLPSPQKSRDNFTKQGRERASLKRMLNDWQETQTFTAALQEIELWIHGRVIESVWWQTLTPYMHSPSEGEMKEQRMLHSRQRLEKLAGPELGDRRQGKFSVDLWKKAFLDAFERLCPVRAGGHECGCLPVLAKMVMEQCVARLDVAMFNAILRQSKEEMPTDPISDPISDLNVLPIPFGNLCFGSGAQLKNVVGNWSRYLTEVVGIDAEDSCQEVVDSQEDSHENVEALLSSFPLLNATSELLMLPKEMLLDKSIRKEVCPMLSLPLIKRILCNFVPDEFCPDPMPLQLMETLNPETPLERDLHCEEDMTFNCLVCAPSTEYSPPPEASIRQKIGDANDMCFGRSASGLMRKGYTSDDEIDEIESPLSLLVDTVPEISPQTNKLHSNGKSGGYAKRAIVKAGVPRRYQLLREAWAEK